MKCKVCSSKYVDEINKRLAAMEFTGETLQEIANDYRKITYRSLQRHNQNCLQAGGQGQDSAQEDDIKDVELEDLRDKALEHYEYAISSGNTKLADSALGHLIRIEELIARRDDRAIAATKVMRLSRSSFIGRMKTGRYTTTPLPIMEISQYQNSAVMIR